MLEEEPINHSVKLVLHINGDVFEKKSQEIEGVIQWSELDRVWDRVKKEFSRAIDEEISGLETD